MKNLRSKKNKGQGRLVRLHERTTVIAASKTARATQPEAQVAQWLKNANSKYIDQLSVGYFNGVGRSVLL
jgi:hypothetical protein